MSDITSGFNIAKNIYLKPKFSDLCGFKEDEIKNVLVKIVSECGFPEEDAQKALYIMRTFYNGYIFHRNPIILL